jgi:dienelactone hydrolase
VRLQALALFAFSAPVVSLAACSSSSAVTAAPVVDAGPDTAIAPARVVPAGTTKYEQLGPAPVGHTIFTVADPGRSRSLTVQAWYPAVESARAAATAGLPMEELVPAGAAREALKVKIAAADPKCIRPRVASAAGADPAGTGKLPVIVYSHCHHCTRFAMSTIAERLASHGFVVVAPDHQGNTYFDGLAGSTIGVDETYLLVRVGDLKKLLDVVLDDTAMEVPAKLRGRFDADKVGVFGHSYGSATTGRFLATDARPKAGFGVAAPWESIPFKTKMADVHVPAFFLLAQEDNSISIIGNNILRDNFQHGNPPLWLAEVADAGHLSFSDIDGLDTGFMAGCGRAPRMTDPDVDVNYIDPASARGIAASYVTSFFAGQLLGDAAGTSFASGSTYGDAVTVQVRK